ncbi:hypothetical protein C8J56DRAFT_891766 [Mycena floridula]|nr:hypothetical protein C8J56DRAFT_891766 [Mycena floridula]
MINDSPGSSSGLVLRQGETDLSKSTNPSPDEPRWSSGVVLRSDETGPSKVVPYSHPEKVPLPVDWDNDWDEWECRDAFTATFERVEIQIYLEVKFHIVFDEVELLMFLPYLQLVMRGDELAVYETTPSIRSWKNGMKSVRGRGGFVLKGAVRSAVKSSLMSLKRHMRFMFNDPVPTPRAVIYQKVAFFFSGLKLGEKRWILYRIVPHMGQKADEVKGLAMPAVNRNERKRQSYGKEYNHEADISRKAQTPEVTHRRRGDAISESRGLLGCEIWRTMVVWLADLEERVHHGVWVLGWNMRDPQDVKSSSAKGFSYHWCLVKLRRLRRRRKAHLGINPTHTMHLRNSTSALHDHRIHRALDVWAIVRTSASLLLGVRCDAAGLVRFQTGIGNWTTRTESGVKDRAVPGKILNVTISREEW